VSSRGRLVAGGLLVLGIVLFVVARSRQLPQPPPAPSGLELVVQDDAEFLHRSPGRLEQTLIGMRSIGVRRARVTAGWSELAPDARSSRRPDFDASDPAAYPQALWASLDHFLDAARRHGIAAMVDIAFWAPRWATKDGPRVRRPRSDIDIGAYRDFAEAVARRYRGDFKPAGARASLAPVRLFTIWNEPNHPGFLLPQWERRGAEWHPASPQRYREMVRAAYPAIKGANPGSTVLIGGTAGRGTSNPDSADDGVPPLRFLRELACVGADLEPIETEECRDFERLPGDGCAHHPYTLRTLPDAVPAPARRDDAPLGSIKDLTDLLDALAARGRIDSEARDVYITEFGYETDPPDPGAPYSPRQVARFLPWSEYLAAANPSVRMHAQFIWRDLSGASRPDGSIRDYQSGLLFADGRPKPGLAAMRAPLHVARLESGGIRFWTHVRVGAGRRPVAVEALRRGVWRKLFDARTNAEGIMSRDLDPAALSGSRRFRLLYRARDRPRIGPAVTAVG